MLIDSNFNAPHPASAEKTAFHKERGRFGVIFIGVSVYLRFFERFYQSVERFFVPSAEKVYFVFTDNHLRDVSPNVRCIHVPFNDPRPTKLHKFHLISSVLNQFDELDYVFYFDADSVLADTISQDHINQWFSDGRSLVGVLHPWQHIRQQHKPFEQDPKSTAHVCAEEAGLMDYHQSCFWGGKKKWVAEMAVSIRAMVDKDIAIGHRNTQGICDELYVNRFFLSHRHVLRSLGTDYANPGSAYERATATADKRGYRFAALEIIVHDNAAQTRSWQDLQESKSFFTHGVYAQFYKNDLAAYEALKCYRQHNPRCPIVLFSDGGDDLSALASKFNCTYIRSDINIGTFRTRHSSTNQYERLKRVRHACALMEKVDWVVILEPDVECLRAPTAIPRYALSGPSRGPAWTDSLQQLIGSRYPERVRTFGLGRNYTGCGGSIFNRKVFVKCFDKTPAEVFTEGARFDQRILTAEDANMSFLFQVNGYDTGGWEDFTGWRTEDKSPFAFAHGNKQFYGKPSPLE